MWVVSCWQYRHPLDLDFSRVIQQSGYLDQYHCRVMFAHVFSIALADFSRTLAILDFVCHIDHEARNIGRLSAGLIQHGHHVFESLVELFYEIVTDDLVAFIPCDLARYEKQLALIGKQSICITTRYAERLRID